MAFHAGIDVTLYVNNNNDTAGALVPIIRFGLICGGGVIAAREAHTGRTRSRSQSEQVLVGRGSGPRQRTGRVAALLRFYSCGGIG